MSGDSGQVPDCFFTGYRTWQFWTRFKRRNKISSLEKIDMPDGHNSALSVARRYGHKPFRWRKLNRNTECAVIGNQEDSVAHLRHAVKHRIDERVTRRVAE